LDLFFCKQIAICFRMNSKPPQCRLQIFSFFFSNF
jgi:hypothetical protein